MRRRGHWSRRAGAHLLRALVLKGQAAALPAAVSALAEAAVQARAEWAMSHFFSKQAKPDEWANLDLVVSAVRAVVGKERILEVATGEQTACFLCLPAAAEKALRGAGYLRDRPRLSRARRNKNVVEVAPAELEALTGGGGKLPQP